MSTMKWTNEEVQEIVREGKAMWARLSREEVDDYFNNLGTYQFLEDVLDELGIHMTDSEEQFEKVHDMVIPEYNVDDDIHEYIIHLNLRTTKQLSDADLQMMVAKMVEQLNNDDMIEVEYAHHDKL